MPTNKGFTMMELLVIIVVVGILASVALPQLEGLKERQLDNMVKKNLEIIKVAQSSYKMEGKTPAAATGYYVASTDPAGIIEINRMLKLNLAVNDGWNYHFLSDRVTASRVGKMKIWIQEYTSEDPYSITGMSVG